jgi:hypothetical protein
VSDDDDDDDVDDDDVDDEWTYSVLKLWSVRLSSLILMI